MVNRSVHGWSCLIFLPLVCTVEHAAGAEFLELFVEFFHVLHKFFKSRRSLPGILFRVPVKIKIYFAGAAKNADGALEPAKKPVYLFMTRSATSSTVFPVVQMQLFMPEKYAKDLSEALNHSSVRQGQALSSSHCFLNCTSSQTSVTSFTSNPISLMPFNSF